MCIICRPSFLCVQAVSPSFPCGQAKTSASTKLSLQVKPGFTLLRNLFVDAEPYDEATPQPECTFEKVLTAARCIDEKISGEADRQCEAP